MKIIIKDLDLAKDLYEKAKKLSDINQKKTVEIVNQLPLKYKDGFWAYIDAKNENEKRLDNSIQLLKNLIHSQFFDIDANRIRLLEIGLAIVDVYPYKALDIFYVINNTYNQIGTLPVEILDLSVEILVSLALLDIDKSLNLLDIIEVDYFKLDALEKIDNLVKEEEVSSKVKHLIEVVKSDIAKYDEDYLKHC